MKEQSKYIQLCQMSLCRHKNLGLKQKNCFISIFAYGKRSVKHTQWKHGTDYLALNPGTKMGFEILLKPPLLLCGKDLGCWN